MWSIISKYLKVIPSGKSFIYIKNKSGPYTDSCGIPEFIFLQSEVWPFKITLCSLLLRKHSNKDRNSPWTTCDFNLNSRPLCQNLSNVLEISKNTSIGGLISILVFISWIMARSWGIHELPGRKPKKCKKFVTDKVVQKRIINYPFKYFGKNREKANTTMVF